MHLLLRKPFVLSKDFQNVGKHCFVSKNIVSDACKGDVRKYSQRGCGLSDTFMLGRVTRIASVGGSVYNIRWGSPQVALSKHKGAYIHALQD